MMDEYTDVDSAMSKEQKKATTFYLNKIFRLQNPKIKVK